ncbi:MAG TPA: DM13 domain-containing protein [Candidatus Limnocylindria bacterium]|nr:DM13 domain-containing protein [Candidatus Limnocylindria bacterium]
MTRGPGQMSIGPAHRANTVARLIRRHPVLSALGALVLAGTVAAPLVAYVIVPALVRSTLVEDLPMARASSVTVSQGELVRINAADYGSGVVRIVKVGDDRFLRFENVDIAGAPDMYVYLSDLTNGRPGAFVDLGRLKATNGSFNYPIPPAVDLRAVRSVVVWCRQFTVTVTYAVLR